MIILLDKYCNIIPCKLQNTWVNGLSLKIKSRYEVFNKPRLIYLKVLASFYFWCYIIIIIEQKHKTIDTKNEGVIPNESSLKDNAINKKFVADYKAKHGAYPSFYAAQAYDTILAIDHAISKSGSTDTAKMRAALASGEIPTTRGNLKMNTNHFPIQNVYLREAVMDADGVVTTKVIETVFIDHADSYAVNCKF